ncbi:MAG: DUF4091 domain-containing protein [Anaerolineae bacterium]|nr:DUF4091 domain-containing protein [Anaerolineae bacterium]
MRRLLLLLAILLPSSNLSAPAPTDAADPWWDEAWPYRIPLSVTGSGSVEVAIDFTAAFQALGLNGALLDIRSLRLVPAPGGMPGTPVSFQETYSTLLDDADDPQIGWSASGVYWTENDGQLASDATRFSQGTGSLKAVIENLPGGYGYPGIELHIASGEPLTDWRPYETLIYDVWPEVNASALDQAPDLYWFKMYNTQGCDTTTITQGGPPLALDRWNQASVSLKPLHTCTAPNLSDITRIEFHTRDNDTVNGNSGLWDDGDMLTLWLDHVRLVDQDAGLIRWIADGAQKYYVYFDTLEHEGHPPMASSDLAAWQEPAIRATALEPEAGGYLHAVEGAQPGDLAVWAASPLVKIGRTHAAPVASAPLRIHAARGEWEPFQLVVRPPSDQALALSISDFVPDGGGAPIPATEVRMHRVDYVPLTQLSDHHGRLGDWPDPLYPIAPGAQVPLLANSNQPLWFTVHVPRSAAPGVYRATVTLGGATLPVELEVWDFEMPRQIHLAGEWGFGWSQVVERYRGTVGGSVQPCYWTLVDALYQDFADHRLVPKSVGWPAGLNYPGGVAYDCNGGLDPDAWGEWGFGSTSARYLLGSALADGIGFPTFLIRGPANNWPPDSRPSSFCEESRGTDPPGSSTYNVKWFQYWAAVSDYLAATGDYAARGYYHIVNEPQTFADYDIVAYLAQETRAHAPHVRILVSEQVEPSIYDNTTYPGAQIDIWMPTISNYEVTKSQARQRDHDEEVWWYFLYGDRPPLPNPTVIDRPGLEARIVPWLAWLERVQGLAYYSTTDWSPDPWTEPWINDGNGDGFLFYPPKDGTLAFDACDPHSNRLVPSIRWELLREGMEDYEYLWLLAGGDPQIGVPNAADVEAGHLIASRTLFSRVPTDLYATRAALAEQLAGPHASSRVYLPLVWRCSPRASSRSSTFSPAR